MPSASAPFRAKAPFHSRKTGMDYRAFPLDFINPPFVNRFGCLSVSPSTELNITGHEGGPFSPATQVYTLTNTGGATMSWTLAISETWLTTDIAGGSILPGEHVELSIAVDADAMPTDPVPYTAFLTFTNTTNDCGNTTILANLVVEPVLPMVLESRFKSGTATMVGYDEYWDLNPPNDAITNTPWPSVPPKKYRKQTLGGGTYIKCNHYAGGPDPCDNAVGALEWREISGSNTYNISTGVQVNTQLLTVGQYVGPPDPAGCIKVGAVTSTTPLNAGAIGRPPNYIPFLYGWGFVEIDVPNAIPGSTKTTLSWTGDPDYCFAQQSQEGLLTYALSEEDTELDAINRMIGSLSYSAYATAATKGAAYNTYELRTPVSDPSDFDFLMRYTQVRLTLTGLTPSTGYSGRYQTYRRLYGTADPWVAVALYSFSAVSDGSGNISYEAIIPFEAGYSYTVWDAVLFA